MYQSASAKEAESTPKSRATAARVMANSRLIMTMPMMVPE